MPRRQAVPTAWLMTDARNDAGLEAALRRLPRGGGVIFRHHHLAPAARRARYEAVRRIARARRLVLVLAGSPGLAVAWRADGAHGPTPHAHATRPLLRTIAVHHDREWRAAVRIGAVALRSPVFPTRSHPGGRTLGAARFGLSCRHACLPVVALGGMDVGRFRRLRPLGADGWAAIDAWSAPDQKRKAVPR